MNPMLNLPQNYYLVMSKSENEFLQIPGVLPWHIKPTRKKNLVSAIIYDAEGYLVAACAYGNAKLIVEKVNGTPTPEEDSDSPYLNV